MPEPSGFYYPNRIARGFFVAMEEVMGKQGAKSVLVSAQLGELINDYPPDNLNRQFDFADLSAINLALETQYGNRGGLGFALGIGRATFNNSLKSFGAMRGVAHPAFRALSLSKQIDFALRGLASIFTNFSDQETEVEQDNEGYLVRVETSPFSWGRQTDRPVCHTLTGIIQESLSYATQGHTCFVRETECRASGADDCVFRVKIIRKASGH